MSYRPRDETEMDRYHEVKQSKTKLWPPSATAIVCRKHFSVEDYKETLLGMYVLCIGIKYLVSVL